VLDHLVLELLERETLNQTELAEVFAPVVKRDARDVWLSSDERPVATRPPVMTPAERAEQNGHPVIPQDEAAAAKEEHPVGTPVPLPPGGTPDLGPGR
jgi:cell division protease FtsH